jgi:hypothetical protein
MEHIIKFRCSFIDLMEKLENISIDFVELSCFNDYIYMDPKNEYNYKISSIKNVKETYSFYYLKSDNIYEIIPHAIFIPENYYDFEIDIKDKKFKKFDEYKTVSFNEIKHTIINMQIEEDRKKLSKDTQNKSLFRKIFGC